MSSTYRRICLSHNPPLVVDDAGFNTPTTGASRHAEHPDCLMGAGRWSGALVEVWLPDRGEWVDVAWLLPQRHHGNLARAIVDGTL